MFAVRLVVVTGCLLLGVQRAVACDQPVGNIVSVEGVVEVRSADALPATWKRAELRQALCANDQIAARERSRAAIQLVNHVVIRLDQRTTLTLQQVDSSASAELGLLEGVIHVLTRFAGKFRVITPYLNAMVEGTEFLVAADTASQQGRVAVVEGVVLAQNQSGEVRVAAGNAVVAQGQEASAAPLAVKPHDVLRWALFYPHIIHVADRAAASPAQQQALQIDQLLGVGRVDEARALLGTGTNQLPLRSLIEIVTGNINEGLLLGQQAVAAEPQSAAAQLALSHALQASGDLVRAQAAAQRATELDTTFAATWTRLAELQLTNADARGALASARRAEQLEPNDANTQTAIGFAHLMGGNPAQAQTAFEAALSKGEPSAQAWLGSALVKIRGGQIADGRHDLEVAAILDPGNAELRNMLSRAYLKESREDVALKELEYARRLDPLNPGPWYTDALRRQQQGDPAGALQSYRQSLDLNGQRTDVRPRTLLEQDAAGRMLSMAGTYRDLGFDGLMLSTASRAAARDPQSAVAHGFMAEAYSSTPGFENARISEQLQAQLRSPIGMAPSPPQSLLSTLPIVGGARTFTQHEFTPLLDRHPWGLQVEGLGGNQSTWGSALSAFKAWDKAQISAGHFHYDTDNVVDDVPVRLDLNNLLFQWQATAALQVQLEGRAERLKGGTAAQNFRSESTDISQTQDTSNDSVRLGINYSPSARAQFLLSAVHRDVDEAVVSTTVQDLGGLIISQQLLLDNALKDDGIELQAQFAGDAWDLALGAGNVDRSGNQTSNTKVTFDPPLFDIPDQSDVSDIDSRYRNAYVYASRAIASLRLHAGFSWDDIDLVPGLSVSRGSPKLGLAFDSGNTAVRAAYISGVHANAIRQQSLQATQFAGFSQLDDAADGTRFREGALALDHRWADAAYSGVEARRRLLDIPNYGCIGVSCVGAWREHSVRLYHSWLITSAWMFNSEVQYVDRRARQQQAEQTYPLSTKTWQIPLRATFVQPGGWRYFFEWRGVRQSLRYTLGATTGVSEELADNTFFGIANLGIRYVRPGRRWLLEANVDNLLDRKFSYQGSDVSGQPTIPLFRSGRSGHVRFVVGFN